MINCKVTLDKSLVDWTGKTKTRTARFHSGMRRRAKSFFRDLKNSVMPFSRSAAKAWEMENTSSKNNAHFVFTNEHIMMHYLHFGRPSPIVIVPVHKKSLMWVDKKSGEKIFAKRVTLPAVRPNPVVFKAISRFERRINIDIERFEI